MWTTILSLVLGGVPAIISGIAKARVDLANAETEKEKVAAQERIKALEMQRDVLIKESTTPWNTIARFSLLGPAVVYLWWVIAWDKIACKWFYSLEAPLYPSCTTDPLSPWLTGIVGVMIGFYFLTDASKIWKR